MSENRFVAVAIAATLLMLAAITLYKQDGGERHRCLTASCVLALRISDE